MEKATLFCPREKVFFKDLFVERYILPTQESHLSKMGKLKVRILEVIGEKVLVLLPKWMARGKMDTALIDIKYLE
ncbi:hypothetical protein J4411_02265 [Candidatus Pacearchaeota archaeon]|nr:hypothetical protein [Candidatus Pacearchaeota archaeon]